ncbi:MAG: hypothetical protein HJJLKODD_02053 [Phycisphaerae bacterium]|nr:hypothetical protein [Phycisphaerae bacterium]
MILFTWLAILSGTVLLTSSVTSQNDPPASAPSTSPATNSANYAASPEVVAILERLEQSGQRVQTLQANIDYRVKQLIKENDDDPDVVHTYVGLVRFRHEPEQTLSWIHFREWNDGVHKFDKEKVWYIFDGHWLTEAKQKTQSIVRRELTPAGQEQQAFKLGEGPFPLPFGQKKDDILREFSVELIAPVEGDPVQTDHLLCRPLPVSRWADQYARIELFISKESDPSLNGLPLRMVVHNLKEATLATADFSTVQVNLSFSASDLELPDDTDGWEVVEEQLN